MKRVHRSTVVAHALLVASALLFAAACNTMTSPSPAAPPTSATAGVPPSSGALVTGVVKSGAGVPVTAGLSIGVLGSGLVVSSAAGGRFTLTGVPAGNVTLQLSGSGVNAAVVLGTVTDRERVDVEIRVNGASATLEAAERLDTDDGAEIEGAIGSINASTQTFQVGSASIQVTSSTVIRGNDNRALQVSNLAVGERVEVKGALQGSTVVAAQIEVRDAAGNPEPEPPGDHEVQVTGVVDSLIGATSCAAQNLAFTLAGGTRVNTSASTRFDDGACSSVAVGARLEIEGVQGAGVIAATRVKLEHD